MKFIPHSYQRYAIERIISDPFLGLFLDMGLGKTVITLSAVNDNLTGCGLNAVVSEGLESQTVAVRFPNVPGKPEGFERERYGRNIPPSGCERARK